MHNTLQSTSGPPLVTPIHLGVPGRSARADGDACYYLLSSSGLFIGRNTPYFRSLVPARQWPAELDAAETSLELSVPRVPARLLAIMIGFFAEVAPRGAEAIVLLGFDERQRSYRAIVPQQVATAGRTYRGDRYPIGLRYDTPAMRKGGLRILGDVHSHAFDPAYASGTDQADEVHRPGLHVVMGRLDRDPPEVHVQYVVDGTRFDVSARNVLDWDGYAGPDRAFPRRWLQRHQVQETGGRRTW